MCERGKYGQKGCRKTHHEGDVNFLNGGGGNIGHVMDQYQEQKVSDGRSKFTLRMGWSRYW